MKKQTYEVSGYPFAVRILSTLLSGKFWRLIFLIIVAFSFFLNYYLLSERYNWRCSSGEVLTSKERCHTLVYPILRARANNVDFEVLANIVVLNAVKPPVTHENWTKAQKVDYIRKVFGKHSKVAIAVSNGEGLNYPCDYVQAHLNKDKSTDTGVFQINSIHLETLQSMGMTLEDMKDCKKNIDFAYWLFSHQGFNPWTAFKNGSYLQFMN